MSDWTGGYVSDVEYVSVIHAQQSPALMDLACLMAGVEPARRPGSNASFTYCDLGCGQASTVTAVAAANPDAQFWGIDFMPAHIARAEAFRREAGVENLTLVEADVAALARAPETDLPRFDYIALHGLYSWVSEEVRSGIVAFLDRFLKPGGLVYLGYNVMPGWTEALPLQKVLIEYAATRQGSSQARMAEAADFAQRMRDAGASGLEALERKKLFPGYELPELRHRHFRYLAHEFLNSNWRPRFHMDVARELAAAKLEFVGSAMLLENFAGIGLPEEAQKLLEDIPAGPLRETLDDYFNVRGFRRDIFVRGRREIPDSLREEMLGDVMLAMMAPRPDPDRSQWPQIATRFALNRETYDPVFDRLEQGPAAIAALRSAAEAAGRRVKGTELVGILVGLELAQPVLHDVPGSAVESCWRHNRLVTHQAFRSSRQGAFPIAVPVGHGGMAFSGSQTLILDGIFNEIPADGGALTAHVLNRLGLEPGARHPQSIPGSEPTTDVTSTGPETEGEDAAADPGREPEPRTAGEMMRMAVDAALDERLPVWHRLGIVPPKRTG